MAINNRAATDVEFSQAEEKDEDDPNRFPGCIDGTVIGFPSIVIADRFDVVQRQFDRVDEAMTLGVQTRPVSEIQSVLASSLNGVIVGVGVIVRWASWSGWAS